MANNNRRFGGWFGSSGFGGAGGGAAGGGGGLLSGGKLIFLGFIGLIIGGGFLFTGGNPFPKNQLTKPAPGTYEIDEESLKDLNDGKKNLQLKTIRFKECAETITVVLMLDVSGSMGERTPSGVTKINRLKEAVLSMTDGLSDESIIGIESFTNPSGNVGANVIKTEVQTSYYRENKAQIPPAVDALRSGGSTPTHDALAFSYQNLQRDIPKFPPDRQFNYIFVSDGAPCPGIGCQTPGPNQDPRLYSPNPATQIKDMGVNIYTLGIYDRGQDKTALSDLLKSIASTPDNYFEASTADDTQNLLKSISERICQSAKINNQ